ncbi:MAG: hypothetical protein WA421_18730 [Nitrososphaeraceae archaeon]
MRDLQSFGEKYHIISYHFTVAAASAYNHKEVSLLDVGGNFQWSITIDKEICTVLFTTIDLN